MEAGKSAIKALADLVSGEELLHGSQTTVCSLYPHKAEVVGMGSSMGFFL